MLSREVQEIAAMLRQGKAASKGQVMTAEKALATRQHIDSIFEKMPPLAQITTEQVEHEGVRGAFYRYDPSDTDKLKGKVLLFLHGGGFMNGSVLSRRRLCQQIMVSAKIDALSVEYTQWPEGEHPWGMMDCVQAYRWLRTQGYEAGDIYVFGESAGAMLALTMMLYLKDQQEPLPGKALIFSPVAGQMLDLPSHNALEERDPMISYEGVVPYYAHADFSSPYVSPAYGDYRGFPKVSIHVGSEEVLLDDARLIYDRCRAAGVNATLKIWDGLFHVFPLFDCPETVEAVEEIGRYFRI